MLLINEENDTLEYSVASTSRQGLMKLFAFATYLIQLFRNGLVTYSQVRYRGVTKRLCRFLRHTVEYVTDHWLNYLNFHQSLPQHSTDMNQVTAHWAVLQIEYDQLFERAVNCMFGNPRSGAWQFLAVIPYSSVSLLRLWKIVYRLHVGISDESDKTVAAADEQNSTCEDWAALVSHSDTRGQFHDRLQVMEENEAFYLLTALANMAITREVTEEEFVKVLVNNIYEATFVNEETREMLSRIGRDLLSAVATSHPFCLSFILTTTQEKLVNIGSMVLYLFRALPLQLWQPSDDDITCISHWLLFTPVPSIENQLARVIITKLNWGESTPKQALALPHQLHRRVALTVLESYLKVSREMNQRSILTEGVKQVTSVMYAPSPEQVFCDWAWNLLTCLRLHLLDQPMRQVCKLLKPPASFLKDIPDPTSAAIQQGSTMNVVKRGLMDRQPLALYTSLLLTTWGHSLPEFCEHGVDCVHELAVQGRYEAVLSALVHIMPLFFNQPEDITSNAKLMSAIQKCFAADQTYITLAKSLVSSAFPGKILNLFAAMLVHHIKNYAKYNLPSGAPVIHFWMQVMICIPDWVHSNSVLFLLDTMCHHAFTDSACWQEIMAGFSEVMKSYEDKHSAGGGLSGLLSWLTAGTTAPNSLLVRSSAPQFPWYTLAVLMLETQQELSSGLWKNLLLELYSNPQITLEEALKKVSIDLRIGSVSSSLLSIYRWGQQVIDLPADHPALPVTLQMYLTLHLARVPPQPGQYECGCVIMRFYQGFVNSSFLGKIKKKVRSAVDYYEAKKAKHEEMEAEEDSKDSQTEETIKLLNAMQLWLDEARLYESGVYLPALPPHLLPQKLNQIFQSNWEPWPESINHGTIDRAADSLLRAWDQHRNSINDSGVGSPSSTPGRQKRQLLAQDSTSEKNPTKSILKRLKTYEPPQPPPPIPPLSPLHLPHLNDNTLNDPEALLYLVQRYTDVTVEHSQTVSLWCKEMCALNCFYRELLPQLWTNFFTKKILNAECTPPKVGRKQPDCTGHASIVVEFSEARLCEGVNAHIEQNRKQHDLVLQQCQNPPPLQLCQAAVSLESIITDLVNEYRKLDKNKNKQRWMLVLMSGRKLFYHIVQLTSDETNFYPPAKQLITSCAEVLGQEFICGHADCQESIVAQVLEWDGHFGGLLAPHFTPAVTPVHTYLTLYSSLSPHALISPDHTFMLLSKFDIERWLVDLKPSCCDQTQLINAIGAALSSLLPQAESSLLVVLELYRVHLRTLLNHKFPEHYIEVLTVMLQVSATPQEHCKEVTVGLWYDFMNILGKGVANFSPDMDRDSLTKAVKDYAQNQGKLSPTMVKDTLKMLSTYFVKQRLECGLYGLYPKYKLHVLPIATFIGLISHVYIVTEFHRNWGDDKVIQDVWTGIEGLWAGWVAPLSGRDRESGPVWLRQLTQDIRLLLPWSPSDVESADIMVHMFGSSLNFMHELIPDNSTILSMTLEYYSSTFAMKEVRSHILAVIHNHLSALPWHHLHPSLQDTMTFTRVVEQYLPECHSFIGRVLVQINWNDDIQAMLPSHCSSHPPSNSSVHNSAVNPANIVVSDPVQATAKLHQCLLNLLVRISMEPSVRQSNLLRTLLLDSENFYWWLVDGDGYQRVVNWWVMSCDPRIVLSLPDRNPVDIAVIQLLHRAAGYTPDTRSFHPDTGAKRSFLVRALVRLLTSATARHKALLSAKPHVFETTIHNLLSHMEETLIATLPKEQQWSEGAILSTEVLSLVTGGASSAALQELSCSTVVKWFSSQSHPSPGLLFPLLVTASRIILHLNHRNAIMQAGLSALFLYADWCGWEGEIHWPLVISSMSFPLTNPTAMLNLASQEGQLYVVFAFSKWQRQQSVRCADNLLLLSSLVELLGSLVPNVTMELGLILLFSEILELVTQTLKEPGSTESVWQHCCTFASRLTCWAEDRSSTGILAAIGLGRQSPLSPGVRLVCRCLSTFLSLQMPGRGEFRTHPCHPHSDVDGTQTDGESGTCTLEQLRLLTSNATYAGLTHPLSEAIQFIEDPAHCIADVHILLAKLVLDVLPDPILRHLTIEANLSPSAPPPPPV
ncbi:ectopic P granules protein 5 homolog [Palaemon carinicauda]|uniref:ectopic P granules protein 5 homolog n=1 Tax=Palaemon carinicauda TaxID=392227 RepID=UPI0035B5F8C3